MTILQLDPPVPLDTPRGPGIAHFLIDYGAEHNLMWTVFLDANGECWTFPNPEIRAQKNITMGRVPINSHPSQTEKCANSKSTGQLKGRRERPAPAAVNAAFTSE